MSATEHTNQLIHETSPYLLQHAHNPVDWHAWNEEALQKSRAENKPILLSIGYSACHWCHVMEHESFENESIAQLMNERFISIKVDREERPDLDQIYQTVCQMLNQQGGWPLTMFLTPNLEPFWGGTYFPPDDRYGRPGFPRVLTAISDHYRSEPDKVKEAVNEIGRALQEMNRAGGGSEPSQDLLAQAAPQLTHAFDTRSGGFGSQPKFPNTMSLEIFLRQWKNSGDESYLKMVNLALRKMAEGGIYDQLGGGFHRYSTDAIWLVPHFEKMLYDNALLTRSYTQAYQATGDSFFRRIAEEVLQYVSREMTSPEGGFYSTQDADSEGEEGKFFVWTPAEIRQVLGETEGALFCQFYDVTDNGNFEHRKSILHVAGSMDRLAKDYRMPVEQVETTLARGRERLFQFREARIKPFRDEKILTGWNGLMISAFAEAGKVFGEPEYLKVAARAAGFIRDQLCDGSRLRRNFCQGQARGEGYLDDYAFLIAGLLDLYEATFEIEWIDWAASLLDTMIALFREEESGDFLFTPAGAESLIVRPRQNHDQAIPSGVSVAAMNLLRLSGLLDRPELRDQATGIFKANSEEMERNPHGTGNLICAWDLYQHGPAEVVILADKNQAAVQRELSKLYRHYLPNKVVIVAAPGSQEPPIVQGKESRGDEMTAYVCRNFTCSAPVTSWDALQRELEAGK